MKQHLQPATRQALAFPTARLWHDGSVIVDLVLTLAAVGPSSAIEELFFRNVARSFHYLMRPLVVLTGPHPTPEKLFANVPVILPFVMKGVRYSWRLDAPGEGTARVTYLERIDRPAEFAWRGAFRGLLSAAGCQHRLRSQWLPPSTFVFDVESSER